MEFSSTNLLKQLDRPEIIDWASELSYYEEAYSFLKRALIDGRLNRNQTLNALHAMFRIGIPIHIDELLDLFAHMATHADRGIRSEAVHLAIGLVRFCNMSFVKLDGVQRPVVFSHEQDLLIRNAVARGLTPKVAQLARKFFE